MRAEAALIRLRLNTVLQVVKAAGLGLLAGMPLVAGGVLLVAASVELRVLGRGVGESLTAPEEPLPGGVTRG